MVAFSGDGVYDHCKVTEKLEQKLERKLIFTWDPMHKAALTDTALRSGKKEWSKRFQWLVELTEVIGKGVTYVAWGKSWKEFFDVCQKLQEDPEETFKMSRPAKFSETKFADHAHEVYTKFRNNFKALIIVLEKAKEGSSGSSDEKKKAEKAEEIQGRIYNWLFGLTLSMVTDVYQVYRLISCILQKIDILPQDKFDSFQDLLNRFRKMMKCLAYENCPCLLVDRKDEDWKDVQVEDCLWPKFHQDVNIALDSGLYQNLNMGMVGMEQYRSRAGTKVNRERLKVGVEEVVRKVEQRGQELVAFIERGLREKVYTDVDVISVENCRKFLDVRNQALRLKEHGSVKISSLHYKTFRDTSLFFEPELDKRLDPDDMRLQWKLFNEVLEDLITIHYISTSLV